MPSKAHEHRHDSGRFEMTKRQRWATPKSDFLLNVRFYLWAVTQVARAYKYQ